MNKKPRKAPTPRRAGKGLIRSLSRAATRTGKAARPVETSTGRLAEPSGCDNCGAIFTRRAWHRAGSVPAALLDRVRWTICPACRQALAASGFGRVLLRGAFVPDHWELLRRRMHNVGIRAARAQTQRRIVSMARDDAGAEVITTSQKLAHRLVRELLKAFRGRATYRWSDDGTLFAVWTRGR